MDKFFIEKRQKRIFGLGIICYLIITLFLTYITNSEIFVFFIGTTPILFSLISLSFTINLEFFNTWFFLLIPLVWNGLFYLVWASKFFERLNRMNGPTIATLNVFFTYVIFFIIAIFWGKEKNNKENIDDKNENLNQEIQNQKNAEAEHYKKLAAEYYNKINEISKSLELKSNEIDYYKNIANSYYKYIEVDKVEKEKYASLNKSYSKQIQEYIKQIEYQRNQLLKNTRLKNDVSKYEEQNSTLRNKIIDLNKRLTEAQNTLKITKENFTTNLRSIEDKCKAINFVIGRVYSDKKGGNAKIRETLKINRILYNAFSKITSNFEEKHVYTLIQILELLQKKLSLLQLPENKLIRLKVNPQIKIKRNQNGTSTILDVLIENDEDPISEYYAEANEVCNNIMKFLKENY